MSDTRYLILLPLKFPDGTPVPASHITETQMIPARRDCTSAASPTAGSANSSWPETDAPRHSASASN